jgi:hypothetical protein
MKHLLERFKNILFLLGLLWILAGARIEFQQIASGTGNWRGDFSLVWYVLYLTFVLFALSFFLLVGLFLYKKELLLPLTDNMMGVRNRWGNFRWLLWFFIFILPVCFFQYSMWGVVFHHPYIRILFWLTTVLCLTFIASNQEQFFGWKEFLSTLILVASAFSIAVSLKEVNNYPFSLGWSEGNRLWDYSILFGSARYDYPLDKKIPVLLDFGRQFVGGLPFIFPGLTISMERFWVGLTFVFPYFLLGLAAFRFHTQNKSLWLILALWAFLFLKQGPIHPPLLLSAALVALAWRMPLRWSIPLLISAGYFAQASRFSWTFAPGIWIVMLEFASGSFSDRKTASDTWVRSAILGISGIFGGFLLPKILITAAQIANAPVSTSSADLVEQITQSGLTSDFVVNQVTHQSLLWYRLLPNSTYESGILFALLLAAGPLLALLIYVVSQQIWKINNLQKLSIVLPLLVFLAVGLVASTKIGGGGDLHNMDMFLISLLFTGVLAWQGGMEHWLLKQQVSRSLVKVVVVLMLVNSTVQPLLEMRSYSFGEEIMRLQTLRDASWDDRLDMLPTEHESSLAIQTIQTEVNKAKLHGEVLFIDQRQLLTFGYITDVPFVPEYEKKILMNEALASDASYFQGFYEDLAAHRFSLIISEPLRRKSSQDSSFQFGEENNAWVKWISIPMLCYYEELRDIKTVKVQLLRPKTNPEDCSAVLPK